MTEYMNRFISVFRTYTNSNLFDLLLVQKIDLAWVFLASSVVNLLMLTPLLYMLQIFDRIFISKSVLTLLTVSGIIIFFYVVSALAGFIRSKIVIALGARIEKTVNAKLFNISFEERLSKEVKNPVSYLDDLTIVRQWLTGAAIFSFFDIPWVPLYVFIMFVMHPILGYVSLVLILVLIIFGIYFARVLGNQDELIREEEYDTNDFLYGKLRNSEVLATYSLTTNFKQLWKTNKKRFYINFNESQKRTDAILNVMKQYRFFANSLALTVGAYLVISGELTLGSMIAASMLMGRTTMPVDSAVTALSRVSVVKEAFWRLEKMLNTSLSKKDNASSSLAYIKKKDIKKNINRLVLTNVCVSYGENEKKVLNNINFELFAGQLTTVVGNSGTGKTTFMKLLSGLVRYEGMVKFDKIELRDVSGEMLYDLIGYLPQDVLMLPGTIAENISNFRTTDSKRVIEVAKLVGIHDFILKAPGGYDSVLAGGYQNLSGGERQRIGLARAIYNNPACVFLDEPNSALDHSGELALKNVINHCKSEGKLVIVVSHRRSVLTYSDKVIDFSDPVNLRPLDREKFLTNIGSQKNFDDKFNF